MRPNMTKLKIAVVFRSTGGLCSVGPALAVVAALVLLMEGQTSAYKYTVYTCYQVHIVQATRIPNIDRAI